MKMSERSRGVTLLSLLAVVQGIVGFVGGIALMMGGTLAAYLGVSSGASTLAIGALLFALSLVAFGVGGGLWLKKTWAWAAALVLFVVAAVVNVLTFFVGVNALFAILPAVVDGVIVWYLFQPQVRSELGQPASAA
jgi:hypothetical protein